MSDTLNVLIQTCPVCNGQGHVSMPPWIPGDVPTWSASGTETYDCRACGGTGLIRRDVPTAPGRAAVVEPPREGRDKEKVDEIRWLLGYLVGGPKWVARFDAEQSTIGGGLYQRHHFEHVVPVETTDANEALAFCRERDAKAMLESISFPYRGILRVEEHMWPRPLSVVEPPREGPLSDAEIERIARDAGIRKSDAMDSLEAAGPSDTLRLVRHIRWLRDQHATVLSDPAIERIRENFDKWAREKFIEPKSDLIQTQIPSLFDNITALRSALSAAQQDSERLELLPELIRNERLVVYTNGVVELGTRYGGSLAVRRQTFATLREAIDAARAAVSPSPEPE